MELNIMNLTKLFVIFITFLLVYEYVFKFYSKVKLYPRGPKPLPFVGNCLMLRQCVTRHPSYLFSKLAHQYGDIFTFYLGKQPIVIISGIGVAKEAFNNYDICDRCKPSLEKRINDVFIGGSKIFSVMHINEEFKFYRSLTVRALGKYLSSNKLSSILPNIVKETVNIIMVTEKKSDFIPFKYIKSIFIRTILDSTFGTKTAFNDKNIEKLSLFIESFDKNILRLFVSDLIPISSYLYDTTKDKAFNDSMNKTITKLFKVLSKENHSLNNFNSIAESLVSVSNKMRNNEKNVISECISDSNLSAILMVLFTGAIESSYNTFRWILLLMTYYPEMQQKMRNEIHNKIGNKTPDITDKENCVYVNAFICETLRYRNVGPFAFAHMTSCDTKISDVLIPKQTPVILNQLSILNDSRYWTNPNIFDPERFINNKNKLITAEFLSFIPFGIGKRICPGDRFAMNTTFLTLSSLLQATSGSKFVLSNNQYIDLEPTNQCVILETKEFKIHLAKDE